MGEIERALLGEPDARRAECRVVLHVTDEIVERLLQRPEERDVGDIPRIVGVERGVELGPGAGVLVLHHVLRIDEQGLPGARTGDKTAVRVLQANALRLGISNQPFLDPGPGHTTPSRIVRWWSNWHSGRKRLSRIRCLRDKVRFDEMTTLREQRTYLPQGHGDSITQILTTPDVLRTIGVDVPRIDPQDRLRPLGFCDPDQALSFDHRQPHQLLGL